MFHGEAWVYERQNHQKNELITMSEVLYKQNVMVLSRKQVILSFVNGLVCVCALIM